MSSTLIGLAPTLLTTIIGSSVGAFATARFGYRQAAFAELDKRRYEIAESMIAPLVELRRLLRNAENSRSIREWAVAIEAGYEVLDDARHSLPSSLGHLKRSVRAAIGEAMGGVAISDLDPRMADYELAPYDAQWTTYAEEYVDGAINTIRSWRDASRDKASKITMSNFDDWLSETDRYQPLSRR